MLEFAGRAGDGETSHLLSFAWVSVALEATEICLEQSHLHIFGDICMCLSLDLSTSQRSEI